MKQITSTYHQQNWSRETPWCVYVHISPSGGTYVGITSRKRLSLRFENGAGYKTCYAFNNAINKYGWDNIEHYIIAEGLTESEAKQIEIKNIVQYKELGISYNIAAGDQGASRPCRKETRQKISRAQIGRKFSDEHREKMSKSHKGLLHTDTQKYRISAALKRHCANPEIHKRRCEQFQGTAFIHMGLTIKRVKMCVLDDYLSNGWIRGTGRTLKKNTAMPKDAINRMRNSKKGMIWICHPSNPTKQIKSCELETYLTKGYMRGRKYKNNSKAH